MKKFIFIKANGFDGIIALADEPKSNDKQNRMDVFKLFYDLEAIKDEGFLNLLSNQELFKLKEKALYFLSAEYRNSIEKSDKSKFFENHFSTVKSFFEHTYSLDGIEDRLAIMCIDLYNINIYSKKTNNPIYYKTANTKQEVSRLNL